MFVIAHNIIRPPATDFHILSFLREVNFNFFLHPTLIELQVHLLRKKTRAIFVSSVYFQCIFSGKTYRLFSFFVFKLRNSLRAALITSKINLTSNLLEIEKINVLHYFFCASPVHMIIT